MKLIFEVGQWNSHVSKEIHNFTLFMLKTARDLV